MNVFSGIAVPIATIAVYLFLGTSAFGQATPPAAGGPPPPPQAQQGGPPPGDPLGPDLFIAIRTGTTGDVKAVLAKGAKIEAANWLGIRPLMWAAALGRQEVCAALLEAGADINGPSHYGTALSFAEMGGSAKVVQFLLEKGAKLTKDRGDGITPLMTAADAGHLDVVAMLLDRAKADVNAKDDEGTTALMFAARRGMTGVARRLIEAGATVNTKDKQGRTALMHAAQSGASECAALLLKHRAAVNAQDGAGNTALILAARYSGDLEMIRLLLRAGTDKNIKDRKGRGALDFALTHENGAGAAAIQPGAKLASNSKNAPSASERARASAQRGLRLIEQSNKTFSSMAACVSCHHQGVGLMATGLAKERGFGYDRKLAAEQVNLILKQDAAHANEVKGVLPMPELYKHIPGVDMGELTPAVTYSYAGLLAHGEKGVEAQAAMTVILASQQFEDGRWGFLLPREPMQSSQFATTALAIRLLKTYMPPDRAAETAQRIAKAKAWLIATKAVTNEDKTFRLLGLKWVDADPAEIAKATKELRSGQRADGGWAQLPASEAGRVGNAYTLSDAYATGQALYALHLAGGMPTGNAAYQKGVRYLLRTQDDDGSWFVGKRAIPANTYLDGGFPHGQSQYISYGATCWATMALMLASPPPSQNAPRTAAITAP